jgi:two-component system chemotaxis sensor kinase CheA
VPHPEHENSHEFFAQFFEDYYAESDEHLTLVRRGLLILEEKFRDPSAAHALLDEFFRSFHTLKGISGMVGLTEAEQLSHQMESYLRLLRQENAPLDKRSIEILMTGTAKLEQVIAARRNEQEIPSIDAVVTSLTEITAESDSPVVAPSEDDQTDEKKAETEELQVWRFVFTPSAALSDQGINVNQVRTWLQEAGEIVRATPVVKQRGEISFEFIVTTAAGESVFRNWAQANLTYERVPGELEVASASIAKVEEPDSPLTASAATMLGSTGVVRVDLERLDDLMRMIGDLVTSRGNLEDTLKALRRSMPTEEWRKLQEISSQMHKQLRDLRDGLIRVRLVRIGEIFERMKFVVRDLARESGKQIKLEISGEQVEIDKFLVERMMDPLLHLVRNAISHGLETPAERRAQNKLPEGRLTLAAATVGDTISIEIADDGRGIDIENVRATALSKGLIDPGATFDKENLLEVLCSPGFSTRLEADRESGRGIGMDVVMRAIKELGGKLSLDTEKNSGTRFAIELPLTLVIAEALIATAGGQQFAIPQSVVNEVLEVDPASVKILENNEIISYRGGVLPLARLAALFNLGRKPDGQLHVFVTGSGTNALGIVVDKILGQREIVVRGIGDPLVQVPGIAGATDVGDEHVVLLLEIGGLRQLAHDAKSTAHV